MSQLTFGAGRGWPGHHEGRAWAVPAARPNPAKPQTPASKTLLANPAIPRYSVSLCFLPAAVYGLRKQVDTSPRCYRSQKADRAKAVRFSNTAHMHLIFFANGVFSPVATGGPGGPGGHGGP